jgi:hypothetical protein
MQQCTPAGHASHLQMPYNRNGSQSTRAKSLILQSKRRLIGHPWCWHICRSRKGYLEVRPPHRIPQDGRIESQREQAAYAELKGAANIRAVVVSRKSPVTRDVESCRYGGITGVRWRFVPACMQACDHGYLKLSAMHTYCYDLIV